MPLDIFNRCRECGRGYAHPAHVPRAEGGNFCPPCQHAIEQRIARSVAAKTGASVGGLTTLDGRLITRSD